MEEINIVYVDDTIDLDLSQYLDQIDIIPLNEKKSYKINYSEIQFQSGDNYNKLLANSVINTANILFIDSKLFENRTARTGKFTGEEFKVVLQKFYPFIEVIIISQNELDSRIDMISKYKINKTENGQEYYKRQIDPIIKKSIAKIMQYRLLAEKMKENESWEPLLKEKVLGTLHGTQVYDELSKKDIDKLINAFKQIKDIVHAG